MPDKWEMDNGLNPLVNDAALDADGDGLTNLEEYNTGTNPRLIHTFTADGFSTDYDRVKGTGIKSNSYSYDADDRLVAAYYSNGAWEAWRYDGNGNILAHTLKTVRDADGDGLPDAWEHANGLSFTPFSGRAGTQGFAGDGYGDGWTNYQEYLAGTDPKSAASHPPAGGLAGAAWFNPPK